MTGIKQFLRYYVLGGVSRIGENHLFLLAGGLAFSLFVCIVPFVLIIFFAVGQVLERAASVREPLEFLIDTVIPYKSQASFVKQTLFSRTVGITWRKGVYGTIGIFGLLFSASGLFSSMRTILNRVYRTRDVKIPLWGKLRDFGMVFLVLFFFLVSMTFLPILEALKDSARIAVTFVEVFAPSGLQKFLYSVGTHLLVFVLFFVLYSLVPYGKQGKAVVFVSALWASLLWEAAKQVFGYYINHFASIERIYGAYVLMVVVVFWIYYSSAIFILGAEIGQLYKERHAAAPA